MLLAVDLGLRTGFALYGADGRLQRYRSQNLGSRSRLRKAAPSLIAQHSKDLERVVLEGGGAIAEVWKGAARRRGVRARIVDAQEWRRLLLLPRERRRGVDAKAAADGLARDIITWSGAPNPKGALRHDAAEAICVGLWGCIDAGWLPGVPEPLRRG